MVIVKDRKNDIEYKFDITNKQVIRNKYLMGEVVKTETFPISYKKKDQTFFFLDEVTFNIISTNQQVTHLKPLILQMYKTI